MRGSPELVVTATPDEAFGVAAGLIADAAAQAITAAGRADVLLGGGEALDPLLLALTALRRDWAGVHFWTGDEPPVGHDDPASTVLRLRTRLAAPGAVLHAPPPAGDAAKRALAYGFQLKDRTLDVAALVLRADGRLAGLAPGAAALDDERPIVPAGAAADPAGGVSFGLSALAAARQRILVATGPGAAGALGRTLGEPSPRAPASLLPAHATTVIADEAARG